MKRIAVIRFSALGDVAMTIPVVASTLQQYPETEIIAVTKKGYGRLFGLLKGNIRIIEADFTGKHAGIKGIFLLFREIMLYRPDFIADFHSVLRTHFLRFLFAVQGIKTAEIDKGRNEKKQLTRKKNKHFVQLLSTTERYKQVLRTAGLEFEIKQDLNLNFDKPENFSETDDFAGKIIGIAPFAKHLSKTYPIDKTEQVIGLLREKYRIILFGGGEKEINELKRIERKFTNVISVAGKYSLDRELQLMSRLAAMFTMDSANMHLAALAGVRVITAWGATHPYAGFVPWNQPGENAIQVQLPCRPCSVYGNKKCWRGDLACMHGIAPETIAEKLKNCVG